MKTFQDRDRIASIDGIRGMAILSVLLIHGLIMRNSNVFDRTLSTLLFQGWMGVDLFFVLSGFLITGILFESKQASHYFRNFYARRVLRIFPVYYLIITLFFCVAPRLHSNLISEIVGAPGKPIWYYLFLCNIYRGEGAGDSALGPTWSLAIEEQFYVVWPAIVFLLSRRSIMWLCGLLVVGAVVARTLMLFVGFDSVQIYSFTLCRVDALAVGGWIALARTASSGSRIIVRAAWAALWVSILGIATIWVLQKCGWWIPRLGDVFRYLFVALLCGAFLVAAITARTGHYLNHLLTLSWLRALGRYSYAMYLIHASVITLVRDHMKLHQKIPTLVGSDVAAQALFYTVSIGITYIVAFFSWHALERHALSLKRFFPSQPLRVTAGS